MTRRGHRAPKAVWRTGLLNISLVRELGSRSTEGFSPVAVELSPFHGPIAPEAFSLEAYPCGPDQHLAGATRPRTIQLARNFQPSLRMSSVNRVYGIPSFPQT